MVRDLISQDEIHALEALSIEPAGNRGVGKCMLAARNDHEAVLAWLAMYVDTPTTLSNYRKEVERLLMWCIQQRRKPLSALTHEDMLVYQHFLSDPQPAGVWVQQGAKRVGRKSPEWRPFLGPLGPASIKVAMSIINSMMSWLVQAGYLAGNPLGLSKRRKKKQASVHAERFLSKSDWAEVRKTIEGMCSGDQKERKHGVRARWVFSLLFIAGIRASELTSARMNDFFQRRDMEGKMRWWLRVTGKGEKVRLVPVTTELLSELMAYRQECGLARLPSHGDERPILLPLKGVSKDGVTRATLHNIVKAVMRATAARVRTEGREEEAASLDAVSAHFLRHTAATNLLSSGVPLVEVRDTLGHASIETTSKYLHSEEDARHESTERAHKLGWGSTGQDQ